MPDYPPTLNIPVSASARQLQPVDVTLNYDDPKEFEGKYGTQYKYSVNTTDGVEHTLFASQALHQRIEEHAPSKGTTLSIARIGEKKDTRWDVVYINGPKDRNTNTSPQPQTRGPNPDAYTRDLTLYWAAFDLAHETLTNKNYTPNVDANAVAFVIYKLAKEHGIPNPADPYDQPPPATIQEAQQKDKMRSELEAVFRETSLPNALWIPVLRAHASENERVGSWEDVTRETGLAAYATARNVKNDLTSWEEFLRDAGLDANDGLDAPPF